MKQLTFLLLAAFLSTSLFAQEAIQEANASNPGGNKAIVSVTYLFYETVEKVMNVKDGNTEPIMRMIDKDFISTRHIIDVDGRQTKSQINLNEYRNQLSAQMSISGLSVSSKIESVNFVKTYESFATISFTLLVTATINGESAIKFRSLVTNYLRKDESGNWRIFESNGVNVYKDQEIGLCPCSITKTSKDESQYGVKVLYPSGSTFNSENLQFTFKKADTKTLILVGKNAYTIEGNTLVCINENGKAVNKKLGSANASSRVEAINLILSQHLYTGKCLGFKAADK